MNLPEKNPNCPILKHIGIGLSRRKIKNCVQLFTRAGSTASCCSEGSALRATSQSDVLKLLFFEAMLWSDVQNYFSKTQFQLCEPLNYFMLPRDDLRLPRHRQRKHAHGHCAERQHQPHIRFACGNAKSANQPSHNQGSPSTFRTSRAERASEPKQECLRSTAVFHHAAIRRPMTNPA